MQYNTPQQERRPTRMDPATPTVPRPHKDYTPKKRKSQLQKVLPLLLLFSALLIVIYLISPKEAGRRVGGSRFDGLVISEVMAANNSAVPDENGEFSDWLELYNGTGADLDMEGVMITNRTDRITFPFPSYTLKAGERVIVFASDSYQLDPSKPFHGKFKISSAGDHLYLYDPDMYLIDELATPTLTADTSYALTGIDEDGVRHYETTTYYSPGYENTEEGFVEYRSANSVESGALVINEVCPDPKVGIPDEDGEIVDWVELKNNTDSPISRTGYYLSDKETSPPSGVSRTVRPYRRTATIWCTAPARTSCSKTAYLIPTSPSPPSVRASCSATATAVWWTASALKTCRRTIPTDAATRENGSCLSSARPASPTTHRDRRAATR